MKITVWSHIEVKEIKTVYRGYQSLSLFGGIYKVKKPKVIRHITFLEEF